MHTASTHLMGKLKHLLLSQPKLIQETKNQGQILHLYLKIQLSAHKQYSLTEIMSFLLGALLGAILHRLVSAGGGCVSQILPSQKALSISLLCTPLVLTTLFFIIIFYYLCCTI